MNTKTVGVLVGRFQINELTKGHLELISYVADRHQSYLIVLGVKPTPATMKDPMDFRTREVMLRGLAPNATILPLLDCSSNEAWSRNLDELISTAFPARDVIMYCGRDGFKAGYCGRNKVEEVSFSLDEVNATEARTTIASCPPRDTADFRAGVIYGISTLYPRVYPTVDIAATCGLYNSICLVRKPSETKWRLPGGFVSPGDQSLEDAATRELKEETGLVATEGLSYVMSRRVDDWRSRGADTAHTTTLFRTPFFNDRMSLVAGDDVAEAAWFPFAVLPQIVDEHKILVEAILND